MLRSSVAGLAVLAAALGWSACAAGEPVTAELLLQQSRLGDARISPDGRWTVVEVRAPAASAATYRFGRVTDLLLSEIHVFDAAGRPHLRLADEDHARGYWSGPIAPDGRSMAVLALSDGRYRLGVLTFETGATRWFDLTPELTRWGRTIAWTPSGQLVVLARPLDSLPLLFRLPTQIQDRSPPLWAAAADGRRPTATALISGSRRDQRVRASPNRLTRLDPSSGVMDSLAEGEFYDLEISPDGRLVAVVEEAEDIQEPPPGPVDMGAPPRRRRLTVLDLETGARRQVSDLDLTPQLLSWNARSDRVAVFARRDGQAFREGAFWSVGLDGAEPVDLGAYRPWVDESQQGLATARAVSVGDRAFVQARDLKGERIWFEPATGEAWPVVTDGEQLMAHDGEVHAVTASGYRALSERAATPARHVRGATSSDASARQGVGLDDFGGLGLNWLDPAGCLHPAGAPCVDRERGERPMAASANGRVLVSRARTDRGVDIVTRRTTGGEQVLLRLNTALEVADWSEVHPVAYRSTTGERLTGWLLVPRLSGEPAPLVVLLYPGAVHAEPPAWLKPGADQLHLNPALLAAAGYAVLVPSLPLIEGRFVPDAFVADLEAAIAAARADPRVDGARVALAGHSFGAYGALIAATRGGAYQAVIAANGYSDLASAIELDPPWRSAPEDGLYLMQMAGWAETGQAHVGASLAADPQAWVDRSPLYAVGRLTAPTLLIDGELDGARSGALFGALYRLNREAELVTYFGEGHVFASPANLIDLNARIVAWLNRHLGQTQP